MCLKVGLRAENVGRLARGDGLVYREGIEREPGGEERGQPVAFVEFRDVRKVYTMGEVEVAAVDGMTFDIERGELVVVVGPSGAGKTTLLNMLGGMDGCSSGTIRLDGREISSFGQKELTYYRRYDIGFVFQFYNLVQNLTALENVELASQICKDPLDAALVLAQVGLGHRLDNFPAQLSGGEQLSLIHI